MSEKVFLKASEGTLADVRWSLAVRVWDLDLDDDHDRFPGVPAPVLVRRLWGDTYVSYRRIFLALLPEEIVALVLLGASKHPKWPTAEEP